MVYEQEIADFLLGLLRRDEDPGGIEVVKSPQKLYQIKPSDTLISSSDAEVIEAGNVYAIAKQILILRDGRYRIKFDLKHETGGGTAYGQVYQNGSALGTEQTNATTNYQTKSEDLNFQGGDTIELYLKEVGAAADCLARNFRVYGTKTVELAVVKL